MLEDCTHIINAKTFSCYDRFNTGRKVFFSNPNRKNLRKIRVDGCVKLNGQRCDFLVIQDGIAAWFLELKGSNVSVGVSQLKETVKSLKQYVAGLELHCYLICSASPASGFVQKYALAFLKETGAKLRIRTRQVEISV